MGLFTEAAEELEYALFGLLAKVYRCLNDGPESPDFQRMRDELRETVKAFREYEACATCGRWSSLHSDGIYACSHFKPWRPGPPAAPWRPPAKPCEQAECADLATHRMFWPGRPSALICDAHKAKAEGVARAMGFALTFQPVAPPRRVVHFVKGSFQPQACADAPGENGPADEWAEDWALVTCPACLQRKGGA